MSSLLCLVVAALAPHDSLVSGAGLARAEPPGVPGRLDLDLDDVRPGVERCLDDAERGCQHLGAIAGEQRAPGAGLMGQARLARGPLRGFDLRPWRLLAVDG